MSIDPKRQLLCHMVATLAYRGGKAVRNTPPSFDSFRVGETSRTPAEILAHIGGLLDWALWLAKGEHVWHDSTPLPWDQEMRRFFEALKKLDDYLASDLPLGSSPEKVFQGPIADAFSHVGQIAMLRRLAGSPVRGENYFKADITEGRVGTEQSPPAFEFD
jgi:hypothetical protein